MQLPSGSGCAPDVGFGPRDAIGAERQVLSDLLLFDTEQDTGGSEHCARNVTHAAFPASCGIVRRARRAVE